MGLGQGNGGAPPGFTGISTLMIRSYQKLGHGLEMQSAWSSMLFKLAAIIFVDDSELLHRALSQSTTVEDFMHIVQRAINDWGGIGHAIGGTLKPSKCHGQVVAFKFKRGKAEYKKVKELPSTSLTIPKPDGSCATIPLKEVDEAVETLGVFTCPSGDFSAQLKKIKGKGLDWAENLRSNYLAPTDAWLGFKAQLYPSMKYGIGTISVKPKLMEVTYQKVYYRLL